MKVVYIFALVFASIIYINQVNGINENSINIKDTIFCTYFGGLGEDLIHSSIIDSEGNIIIAGVTSSANFPLANAYQENYGDGGDSFIAKISSDGQEIIFSTFLGGSEMDIVSSVSLDNNGDIVVMGFTFSTNFPTLNPIQGELNGTCSIFISKFNPVGTLLYSSYFGGTGLDTGRDVAFDSNNNYIIIGHTTSSDFPVTLDAFQGTFGGGTDDVFITQISEDGQTLLYSTFLGDDGIDGCSEIVVDTNDCAIICGVTNSTLFNTTQGAYQTTFNGGINDCFITCLNLTTKQIEYSTLLGGIDKEMSWGLTLDNESNIILTGYTHSNDFPTSLNAFQSNHNGEDDIFVSKFNSEDYSLNFSTFLGGSDNEYGYNVLADEEGFVYVVGNSYSSDFPVSSNAFQSTKKSFNDAIISILDPNGMYLNYSTFVGGNGYDYGNSILLNQDKNLITCGSTSSDDLQTRIPIQENNAGLYDCTISKYSLISQTDENFISLPISTVILFVTSSILIIIKKRIRKNS
jgi:hypothetical protein